MDQSFPIAPAGAGPLVLLAVVGLVVLAVAAGVGRSVLASRTATFEIGPQSLTMRGDWWGREIPRSALRTGDIRVVSLREERDLQPTARTWGSGLPGYAGGWFRLRNGEKALVYLTDWRRAVVVPTNLGYTVLLSPRDADGFAAALRR